MILVRAARFRMGSTREEVLAATQQCGQEVFGSRCHEEMFADELPAREVHVSAFWLDRTEVSVDAYAQCVRVGACQAPPRSTGTDRFERPNLPRTRVTWTEASQYCSFRAARLPTEAEYERAMRGHAQRQYPWGRFYNSHAANHGRLHWSPEDTTDGYAELAPVGSFPAGRTSDGFLDLAGNAEEWVQDRYAPEYDPHDRQDPSGPVGPIASGARVLRGGGYRSAAPWLRAAARNAAPPETRRPDIGFRCARSAQPSKGR
jgi:formylglycine-generating enzyme required for sulfatase activity